MHRIRSCTRLKITMRQKTPAQRQRHPGRFGSSAAKRPEANQSALERGPNRSFSRKELDPARESLSCSALISRGKDDSSFVHFRTQ